MKMQPFRLQSTIEVPVSILSRSASALACSAIILVLANCSADAPTSGASTPTFSLSRVGARHDLLACPGGNDSVSVRKVIGRNGGRIELGGFAMDVPKGALLDTTTFVMKVPLSQVLKVRIHARGVDHFTFEKPVSITLDYSRCSSVPADPTGWYVDETTDREIEQMPGFNNAPAQSFTLQTGHLSGYALAN